VTAQELRRLTPGSIKVIGGPGVVSDAVVANLRGFTTSGTVQRVSGDDRYQTAVQVSADAFDAPVPVAYIATGTTFPDALAGVAAAGSTGGPILLVEPDRIPAVTAQELSRLAPNRIVVLGGTGVVSERVRGALGAYATSGSVTRLAGTDRYATAAAISSGTFSADAATVFVATGTNFPDALGGGPVAGGLPAPLLLVPTTGTVPASVASELRRIGPAHIVILGGTGSVSSSVASQIEAIASE
jgi:putative cell wall-binding protein